MMNYFKEDLKTEQRRIQRFIDLTGSDQPLQMENAAHRGCLSVDRRGDSVYCYEVSRGTGSPRRKKYLGDPDSPQVKSLIDARFREEKLRRLRKNAQLLEKMEAQYLDYDPEAVLSALPRTYQGLTSDDRFNQRYEEIRQWAAEDYPRNASPFPQAKIFAKDGRRMRSKGECIFYNLFAEHRLPNRYDSIITIADREGNVKKVSPDFVVQCLSGKLIIIEHLGWYSGMKYGYNFGEKCYWYLQGGFVLGENFFVTSDDANGGTDSQMIQKVVRQVERMFYGY